MQARIRDRHITKSLEFLEPIPISIALKGRVTSANIHLIIKH